MSRRPPFTLLVAGNRGGECLLPASAAPDARPGKTSFLRLLLDSLTSAHSLPCAGRTALFTTTHVLVNLDAAVVPLTLIDSPSLDFADELAAERTLADTLRLIDHRFLDDLDRRHVHLCVLSSPLSVSAHPPKLHLLSQPRHHPPPPAPSRPPSPRHHRHSPSLCQSQRPPRHRTRRPPLKPPSSRTQSRRPPRSRRRRHRLRYLRHGRPPRPPDPHRRPLNNRPVPYHASPLCPRLPRHH